MDKPRILIVADEGVDVQAIRERLAGLAEAASIVVQTAGRDCVSYAQKLDSLGIMAAGLAHDFNNLLTPILGFSGLIRSAVADDSPLARMAEHIEDAARRAAELVRHMLSYSGKARLARAPLNLSELVEQLAPAMRDGLGAKVRLTLDLERELPLLEGDALQLQEVILSLLANAAEALPARTGNVEIRTGAQSEACGTSFLLDEAAPCPCIWLEVRDDGCGIPAETLPKVFDPFFTTKFTGRGLGLAACLGIVRSHGGAIQAESAPGRGTTMRLLFPVCQGSEVAAVDNGATASGAIMSSGSSAEENPTPTPAHG